MKSGKDTVSAMMHLSAWAAYLSVQSGFRCLAKSRKITGRELDVIDRARGFEVERLKN